MSRRPTDAKLTPTMSTAAHPTELLVRFEPDSDPPTGSVRDPHGAEHPFTGWLVLLQLLEHHRPTPHDHRRGDAPLTTH
jgi:hypothetical protein